VDSLSDSRVAPSSHLRRPPLLFLRLRRGAYVVDPTALDAPPSGVMSPPYEGEPAGSAASARPALVASLRRTSPSPPPPQNGRRPAAKAEPVSTHGRLEEEIRDAWGFGLLSPPAAASDDEGDGLGSEVTDGFAHEATAAPRLPTPRGPVPVAVLAAALAGPRPDARPTDVDFAANAFAPPSPPPSPRLRGDTPVPRSSLLARAAPWTQGPARSASHAPSPSVRDPATPSGAGVGATPGVTPPDSNRSSVAGDPLERDLERLDRGEDAELVALSAFLSLLVLFVVIAAWLLRADLLSQPEGWADHYSRMLRVAMAAEGHAIEAATTRFDRAHDEAR